MSNNFKHFLIPISLVVIALYPHPVNSQVVITEEQRMIKTYPFSDPDPVPNVYNGSKIYPYYKFEGYSFEGQDMPWKIIRLENDFIEVYVMPESGGKIWGAIEKSTGGEFIYRNEVMKFRNIAMRGPWTSGGIELNFGIIGHSPSTATKVDYLVRENKDGSVSCFVGNLDLPSRTVWRVEVRLPADKAYFETHTMWYNPTSLNQSYYNWMTAAAAATDDLEFFYPGNFYLKHSGEPEMWPGDAEGRDLSFYSNNNFGPSKSYHVVGSYEDYFGGYFHDSEFGFGHWAPYEEMPGQKLWLWALSRSGGIWEDLLTDTDGQYIEFQAGRLFNQYSAGSHLNPVRQVGFAPHATDRWDEVWFPFKTIRGMVNASPYGVLNVTEEDDMISLGINALQDLDDTLTVKIGSDMVHKELLRMAPMDVFTKDIEKSSDGEIKIAVGNNKLYYSSRVDSLLIKRPFEYSDQLVLSGRQQMINEGTDAMNYRVYDEALKIFKQLLEKDPSDREALLSLAELYFRRGEHDKSLHFSSFALMQNTYDAKANFLAGIAFQKKSDPVNALESFGWAARSVEYRSAAYTHMAEIYTRLVNYGKAIEYAQKSLDYNKYNITARSVQIIAKRLAGGRTENLVEEMLEIDPLNHLARYEKYVTDKNESNKANFTSLITNEFPEETYLELALFYHLFGLENEAKEILEIGPSCVKNDLWLAYILRSIDPSKSSDLLMKCIEASPAFVFPYRLESLEMLEWARKMKSSWKLDYYLAINYAGLGRMEEASDLFMALGESPDYWVFYLARKNLVEGLTMEQKLGDLIRAMDLEPESWRTWEALIQFYLNSGQHQIAAEMSKKAGREFPDNYTLGFLYAKALLNTDNYQECINILNDIHILPFEGATESRRIYEEAHIRLALNVIQKKRYKTAVKILEDALRWPENIGVGKPYNPEQRKAELLLIYCYEKLGNESLVKEHTDNIVNYTNATIDIPRPDHYLGLMALKMSGKEEEADELLIRLNNSTTMNEDLKKWIFDEYKKGEAVPPTSGRDDSNYDLLTDIGKLCEK